MFFQDITILKLQDINSNTIMNSLYGKLHLALVKLQTNDVGISFPEYKIEKAKLTLGNKIHLCSSSEASLIELNKLDFLENMSDYVEYSKEILYVPRNCIYAKFYRVQLKPSIEKVRRRQMKRKNWSYETSCEKVIEPHPAKEIKINLPFVSIKSSSTDQVFKIFIKKEEVNAPVEGSYNTYGLSKIATVPIL